MGIEFVSVGITLSTESATLVFTAYCLIRLRAKHVALLVSLPSSSLYTLLYLCKFWSG